MPEPHVHHATIFYFSGTGNTQLVAERIGATFREQGIAVSLSPIERAAPVSPGPDTLLGIGFPIAAFTTYPLVWDFVARLPSGGGAPAFGFCTMGGATLWGVIDELRRRLIDKGYRPVGFGPFAMPLNIFARMPEQMQRRRIERGLADAGRFAESLARGASEWHRISPLTQPLFALAEALFGIAAARWHQRAFKMKCDATACTRCGVCATRCPVGNVRLGPTPVFGDRCQYCLRCAAVCAQGAITPVLSPRSLHYRAPGSQL